VLKANCLEGITVTDFSWVMALPLATRCLADSGAKVIKVESEYRIDNMRMHGPYARNKPGINRNLSFAIHNSNKYSININLNNPAGLNLARKLVSISDIVTENYRPGVIERLGLGYDELKKIKSDIVMIRSSAQGQNGPYSQIPGLGLMIQGVTGISYLLGWPDRPPVGGSQPYTDFIAPWYTVIAAIFALHHRDKTGEGQCIDFSQLEAGVSFLGPSFLDYMANSRVATRSGNRSIEAAPHGAYKCRGHDRWCAISIFNETEWQAFCQVSKLAWTSESRFATLKTRKENEDELDLLIETWTSEQEVNELMIALQNAGVPAGIVSNGKDLLEDPQLAFRNHFLYLKHPEVGIIPVETTSFKLSKTPVIPKRPGPCFGEHNEYVCREILGLSQENYEYLIDEGAIE